MAVPEVAIERRGLLFRAALISALAEVAGAASSVIIDLMISRVSAAVLKRTVR